MTKQEEKLLMDTINASINKAQKEYEDNKENESGEYFLGRRNALLFIRYAIKEIKRGD